MLSDKDLEDAIERMTDRLDDVNRTYVQKVAQQVMKIGELNQSSVNRLVAMRDTGADVADINRQLQQAMGLNIKDLFTLYQQALDDMYTDQRFKAYLEDNPLPQRERDQITQYVQGVSVQTANSLRNLSNTTAVNSGYSDVVDKAVLATSTGVTDYQSAIRDSIRKLGYNGLQVQYPSGYHRRLDTALRQNIVDGVNQINQNASIMMGEALGYDAVEISAHMHSAPDHEPVQGRVFLKAEFDKMQSGQDFVDVDGHSYKGFKRPIGEWNCQHIAMAFSTEHSVRRHNEDQLKQWAEDNDKGCEIAGKHLTTYQASQYMRKLETEIRRQKDAANLAKQVDDDVLRRECQLKINALSRRYYDTAAAAGLTPRKNRLMVQGFRAVRV